MFGGMAAFSIAELIYFFSDDKKYTNQSEYHYHSDQILSFNYSDGIMTGTIKASLKEKVYSLQSKCSLG